MRWLNAVALDVDCRDEGFSFTRLLRAFLAIAVDENLPFPNLICSSGRGLWALWQIKDDRYPGSPVWAWPDKQVLVRKINRAICDRFAELGADVVSTDVSRVMRCPGSINSSAASDNQVVRFFRTDQEPYSLWQLAAAFAVKPTKVEFPGESTQEKNQAKVRAGRRRWAVPLQGFEELWRIRGAFVEGYRHSAVFLYALLLNRNRVSRVEILNQFLPSRHPAHPR
jgi:hypothetical protein